MGKGPNPTCSHFHSVWIPNMGLLIKDLDPAPRSLGINVGLLCFVV